MSSTEHTCLRWAGMSAVAGALVQLAQSPAAGAYPHNGSDGAAFLAWGLPGRRMEILGIGWAVGWGLLLQFMILLGVAYTRRAGRTTAAVKVMTYNMICVTTVQVIAPALDIAFIHMARHHPGFGTGQAERDLITLLWGACNILATLSMFQLSLVWVAVFAANHRWPLLPPVLGRWGTAGVAVLCVAAAGSLFVPSGPWAPGSLFAVALWFGVYAWIIAAGVIFLRRAGLHAPRPDSGTRQSVP
ncbi:hypothetical protein C9F11_04620 [Streptomyces sp. YIM 121038]|uniref:hypothetical protein n=1 Tax=Streptomyces sp. YIM 121038 TaxID=2136401 RepID=UPI001110272A|nr:hypothetical protein [Streptomyces sp. YIM 121038]QCX74627.1 hypothetical protein C9F11_04620 [Streptomyces sp. YIM 121038]